MNARLGDLASVASWLPTGRVSVAAVTKADDFELPNDFIARTHEAKEGRKAIPQGRCGCSVLATSLMGTVIYAKPTASARRFLARIR
jgi:hypothetical protein